MKQVTVKLHGTTQTKEFIDDDVRWTNINGYLTIYYGNEAIAEFQPSTWDWAELGDAPTSYTR